MVAEHGQVEDQARSLCRTDARHRDGGQRRRQARGHRGRGAGHSRQPRPARSPRSSRSAHFRPRRLPTARGSSARSTAGGPTSCNPATIPTSARTNVPALSRPRAQCRGIPSSPAKKRRSIRPAKSMNDAAGRLSFSRRRCTEGFGESSSDSHQAASPFTPTSPAPPATSPRPDAHHTHAQPINKGSRILRRGAARFRKRCGRRIP